MAREGGKSFIIIQSVPRSGSTWLGQIVNSCKQVAYRFQPIHSYSFEYSISCNSTEAEVHRFFDRLALSDEPFINMHTGFTQGDAKMPRFSKGKSTRFAYKETHDFDAAVNAVESCSHLQMIGLVRNPIDVINSWYQNPFEFSPDWRIEDEWWDAPRKNGEYKGNLFGVKCWIECTHEMLRLERESDRFRLVKYENLASEPIAVACDLFAWLALPMDQQTISFLKDSTSGRWRGSNPYSVFRGRSSQTESSRSLPKRIQDWIQVSVHDAGLGEFLSPAKR
jgi:hypothetical protein